MTTVRLLIAYDGTFFSGWQAQADKRTVQGEIERALGELLAVPVRIFGAGRTDGGVHASGQVAHFTIERPRVPPERLHLALPGHLPKDIRVLDSMAEREGFHACFSAVRRVYRYRLATGPWMPWQRDHYGHFPHAFSPDRAAAILSVLEGEHDFESFTLHDRDSKTSVRRMHRVRVEQRADGFDIVFEANGFLRKMIRMLVGTFVMLYPRDDAPAALAAILAARNNALAGPPAASGGLYLERVDYV